MSTIAERVVEATKAALPWLAATDIEMKIVKLDYELSELVTKFHAAAYKAEANFPGAAAERDTLAKQRDDTARALENARAALQGAEEARRERLKAKADDELRKPNVKALKFVTARSAAAKQTAEGIAQAVAGWRALVKPTRDLEQLVPTITLNHGADILGVGRLKALLEAELYRQGATGQADLAWQDFPGGSPHQEVFLEDHRSSPASVPPLVETVEQLNRNVTALLDGGKV